MAHPQEYLQLVFFQLLCIENLETKSMFINYSQLGQNNKNYKMIRMNWCTSHTNLKHLDYTKQTNMVFSAIWTQIEFGSHRELTCIPPWLEPIHLIMKRFYISNLILNIQNS